VPPETIPHSYEPLTDEAARSQRIQQFMLNLFQGGDQEAGPADSLRVISLVHRGVQEARNLIAEPVVQAELYETLGGILQQLGELDGADSLLRAGLSRRQAIFGPDHAEVARSLVSLGLLRAEQAKLPEAERLIRDGVALARRRLRPDHPQVAEAATALGYVLEKRGESTRRSRCTRKWSGSGARPATRRRSSRRACINSPTITSMPGTTPCPTRSTSGSWR
jgi:serine/threonine-protein kinase